MKVIHRRLVACALIVVPVCAFVWFSVRAATIILYSFVDRGGVSLITRGGNGSATVGYARIQPNGLNTTPSGLAIFGFRQGGVLVSEAGVPASPLIDSGRIYAEVNGPVNTGIAVANPNAQPATISFSFTNSSGVDFGAGTKTVAANSQFAAFLNEPPFNAGNLPAGTFTFTSTAPISVIALRGLTNERSEFLITTLPVTPLTTASTAATIFPHFADGGGWTTQVVLVNPGDSAISGTVEFMSQGTSTSAGQPLSLTVNGQTGTSFNYSIERRSSVRLQTSGGSSSTGSIRVTPSSNQSTPSGLVIFSFKSAGFTVSEAGVPALRAATAFRLYAEASSLTDSILSGIAIANPSSSSITVNFELTPLSGGTTLLNGTATIPANGQMSKFLNQIDGLQSLPRPFKGILRVSTSSAAGIAVIGLRSRMNQRGDFLITTTPPTDETLAPSTAEAAFPHFVDNGGYTTQFVLYSGSAGQQAGGALRIFGQSGQPLDLGSSSLADLAVSQTSAPPAAPIGTAMTYSISVTNNGPQDANDIQLTDWLPSTATFESVSVPCPGPSAGVLTCNLGSLRPGTTTVVNVVVRPTATAALNNIVIVGSNEDDPVTSNNRSVMTTNSAPASDLEITQPRSPLDCNLNGPPECRDLSYEIKVLNKGPASATNVTVTDFLPTDPYGAAVVEKKSVTTPQGSCITSFSDRFTCNLGTLSAGSSVSISLKLDFNATARGQTVINRTSVISNDVVDPVTDNNSDNTARTTVSPSNPQIELDISQFDANPKPSVTRPTPLTLTAMVQNFGPSTATNVVFTTTFSSAVSLRSFNVPQGTCSLVGTKLDCNLGTLIKTSKRNISIMVVPLASGPLNIEAKITGTEDNLNNGTTIFTLPTINVN